jgi:NTP pyrophosphatase (non-canonical NTP hydrolase)
MEVIVPKGIIGEILQAGQMIQDNRSPADVFLQLSEEVGELATELSIYAGYSKKEPGPDKIPGEAVDVIICAIDLIYRTYNLSEAEIEEIIRKKVEKWINKSKT